MKRRTPIYALFAVLALAAAGGQWMLTRARPAAADHSTVVARIAVPASKAEVPSNRPPGYRPQVATGVVDYHGNAAGVACMTCHSTRTPNLKNGIAGVVPKDFHQGLAYAHGGQSCLSCHHADDYGSLRLADGRKAAFSEAQLLCAQCHGPQTRDYLHGSHGGMNGYWDKTKGARTRNTCTDCHDPHAPAYPQWTPVFAPRDGGARQQATREAAHAETPNASHHD
jgi:formate-dependent nitrite reductase cytochrome c552 subunit